jgi:hypothetical protein
MTTEGRIRKSPFPSTPSRASLTSRNPTTLLRQPEVQAVFELQPVTKEQKQELDKLAADWVYNTGKPFTMFETPEACALLQKLRPGYKPPSRKLLASTLLDSAYQEVQTTTWTALEDAAWLSIVVDETTYFRKRVVNIFIHTPEGAFFLCHLNITTETLEATQQAQMITKKLYDLLPATVIAKITSFSTDTCSTMQATWKALALQPEFSDCLFIPCESHSLNLIVNDWIDLPDIYPTFKRASDLVNFVRNTARQLAIVSAKQGEIYGTKSRPLVTAALTRWGTVALMLERLLEAQRPLELYLEDPDAGIGCDRDKFMKASNTIRDGTFWQQLRALVAIFRPIADAIQQSQDPSSHLGLVFKRWLDIRAKVTQAIQKNVYNAYDEDVLWGLFDARQQRQLRDVHYLSFLLMPQAQFRAIELNDDQTELAMNALRRLLPPPPPDMTADEQMERAWSELTRFRRKSEPFAKSQYWVLSQDAVAFWMQFLTSSTLATVAIRLLQTVANSAECERGFSTLKFIHSLLRSRLTDIRVEMLIFIYINRRVFSTQRRRLYDFTPQAMEEFEQDMTELQESGYSVADIYPILSKIEVNKRFREGLYTQDSDGDVVYTVQNGARDQDISHARVPVQPAQAQAQAQPAQRIRFNHQNQPQPVREHSASSQRLLQWPI